MFLSAVWIPNKKKKSAVRVRANNKFGALKEPGSQRKRWNFHLRL